MTEEVTNVSVRLNDVEVEYKKKTQKAKDAHPAMAVAEYTVQTLSDGFGYFTREELIQWQKDMNTAINIVLSKTGPEPSTLGTATAVGTAATRAGRVYPGTVGLKTYPESFPSIHPPHSQFPYAGSSAPNVFEKTSPIFSEDVPNFNGDVSSPNFLKKVPLDDNNGPKYAIRENSDV